LATQSASDGDGGTDRLLNMEGVLGSLQNDQVSGDGLANILDGNGGNDTLDGSGGDDVLKGQDGNDVLISGMGRDYLLGGNGTDTLKLTPSGTWSGSYWAQNDFLVATGVQTASHKMTPLSGLNRFESVSNGGADYDTLELTTGNDALALDDILTQMNSEAAAELGRVVDIELINAGDGNDMVDLSSTRFNSTGIKVDGGAGNDVLWGGVGADQLLGGTGNDVLLGATGNDTLTGGAGADSFLFAAGSGQDTITDFSVASGDKVRLLGGTASGATVAYSSNNADTLLAWNGQQVTLTGVQLTGTAWFEYSA
jgi:Ca2+-binding RTX toxin-like protein